MRVGALVRSPSTQLLAMDQDGPEGARLLPTAVDSTRHPETPCHFGSAFFSPQTQRFFVSVMLDSGILFRWTEYHNGRSFAGRY